MGKKFHQRPFKITDLFGNDFSMCKQMVPLHLILLWAALQFEPGSCYPRRFHRPGNVTLGVILPLHVKNSEDKCGEFYPRGLGFIEAITFAIDRINNDTNLLPNVTLGFDIRDYCDTPVLAMSTAYDFVKSNYLNELPEIGLDNLTDPISAVIGAEDSSSSTLISSLLQVVGIPTMSPLSTSEELSSPYFSTFFRTIPPDGEQAKAMVDIIEHYGWTYIAAVAIDNSYGRYGLRALEREAYDRRTFCVAFSEYFTYSSDKRKIKTIVRTLKAAENIKVVVLWSNYEAAKRFLAEATSQGLEGRTFLISESIAVSEEVLEENSAILKGALAIQPYFFADEPLEKHLRGITVNDTRSSANPWWEEFWTNHLNCSWKTGSTDECRGDTKVDQRAFSQIHTAYCPYVTDAVYALAHAIDSMYKCKEASGLLENGKCPSTHSIIKPEDIVVYLRNVSFDGITGRIQFTKTGDPFSSSYDIVNLQKRGYRYATVEVGTWIGRKRNKLTINSTLIKWSDPEDTEKPVSVCSRSCRPGTKQTGTISCCWECIKCPVGSISTEYSSQNCSQCPEEHMSNEESTACLPLPVINIRWSDTSAVIFTFLTTIGLFGTCVTFTIFLKNRNTPLVKASNRELSFFLLFAIALCFVLTLLHLAQPSTVLCCIVYPWRYFVNTACVSVLFLKTNRLVQAFQAKVIPNWFKRYVVDRKRQFLVVSLLNMVEVILTVLWLVIDPPHEHQEVRPQTHVFHTCLPFRTKVGMVFRAVMFSYFIFLSVLASIYAFKARHLPENFNEARYIGFAMNVLLISWVSFYPVDSSLEGYYTTIVACATALVTAYGLLLCIFAPKLFVIVLHPEQNTHEFTKAEIGQFTSSVSQVKMTVQPASGIENDSCCSTT
ncbi:extracellular calcium-sensing receptor-like [Stylophora pistillata]|uniref:extracellular calcium-sensing receptor-like n=1 Tax=Stylophora pistillata TaxID=50429 RepID=UPI000C03BD9D|nr:extracellular calcium-sensing receptor-like [Stylophora pistillata]